MVYVQVCMVRITEGRELEIQERVTIHEKGIKQEDGRATEQEKQREQREGIGVRGRPRVLKMLLNSRSAGPKMLQGG
jgi:hypothetical protein